MRRGDFVRPNKQAFGYRPATRIYLKNAIEHYRHKFRGRCLAFIVLGNDYQWNQENSPKSDDVLVLEPSTAGVDMCILGNCDHSIISSGTFGWWSAWLANGYTVYDKHQANPGSSFRDEFGASYNDYIPDGWKPL